MWDLLIVFSSYTSDQKEESKSSSMGTCSQEIELGSKCIEDLIEPTPFNEFYEMIKYLPKIIRDKALAHFVQKESILKGNITIEDAKKIAKIYQQYYEDSLKTS